MDIKPCDVLFVWSHDIIGGAIEQITHGPAHVALFVNSTTLAEAQLGQLVGEVPLEKYTKGNSRLEVFRDLTLTDEERAEMLKAARTLYGTPYDTLLIPLEYLHRKFNLSLNWVHETHRLICSTFVERVAESVNHRWSLVSNPAPEDERDDGKLTKIGEFIEGNFISTKHE